MAMKRLGINFESYRMIEFDKYAVKSYNAVHNTDYDTTDIRDIHGTDFSTHKCLMHLVGSKNESKRLTASKQTYPLALAQTEVCIYSLLFIL